MGRDNTATLIRELGRYGEAIEIELVDATHKAERGAKPGSRPPTNPHMLSDLVEAWDWTRTQVEDWLNYFDLHHAPTQQWAPTTIWLALHWPNTDEQHPAAQEFYEELAHRHTDDCRDLNRQDQPLICQRQTGHLWKLRHHTGIETREWKPLGKGFDCPIPPEGHTQPCNGQLLVHTRDNIIRCPRCGNNWHERDYERLGLILGCDPKPIPLTLASNRSGIPERTLRNWIHAGALEATKDGRTWLIDVRDVLRITRQGDEHAI